MPRLGVASTRPGVVDGVGLPLTMCAPLAPMNVTFRSKNACDSCEIRERRLVTTRYNAML